MTTAQLLHFVVRNVTYTNTLSGVSITCYTNNPCHLWLRWTNVVPQKHINPVIVRGAPLGTFIDQCFVVYTDLEQNEAGDTSTHTFTCEPWPTCETRWFYFWGTVNGVLSPSRSAIFSYHRTGPTITSDHQLLHNSWGGFLQYWAADSQTFMPDHDYHLVKIELILAQVDTLRRGPYEVRITRKGGSCWLEPILYAAQGYSDTLPVYPTIQPITFPISGLALQKDVAYRIVPICTTGWQRWNGSAWVPADYLMALWFRYLYPSTTYTRGSRAFGCNFSSGSGAFVDMVDTDWYFALYE
jgi:hypothetical protein